MDLFWSQSKRVRNIETHVLIGASGVKKNIFTPETVSIDMIKIFDIQARVLNRLEGE